MLLRHYLERGLNKAEIARELGVSRRTVYNWIEGGQLDRDLDNAPVQYTPRPAIDREVLLGHANHSMAGHYASADIGRLLKKANLVLKREEMRTVLRVANDLVRCG